MTTQEQNLNCMACLLLIFVLSVMLIFYETDQRLDALEDTGIAEIGSSIVIVIDGREVGRWRR